MKEYAPLNLTPYKFNMHDAVYYEGKIGRIEERAVDGHRKNIYLVQMSNHLYRWIPEEYLEVYIG